MNIETVNELIASLESAGELSIKETKVMALAKAYQQLAAENAHLKSRMQRLIYIIRNADNDYCMCGDLMKSHVTGGCGCPTGMFDYHYDKWLEEEDATPATDRIVAGIKADGVESGIKTIMTMLNHQAPGVSDAINVLRVHSSELREGADK
ncbi:TPA: ead/Ea22-like family protein [Klebsiella pneumoniae]|uniref:ead/Ea22-like family protein n=1 Tax=Klebsiella pneumoniae TaxID=573 RepID=UPI001CA4E3DC|nr:ead/Ea22-like family protein [Klebsiella pneumoniae]HDK6690518.1 ead/Ea22-like family protein [Klebsiella quasipneumoniae]MBW6052750.1 hypothetical protein [Klebsiella pneumoniae]HBQ7720433.1 ead/Ea22-like family protein [Klebsiella pneumoniae]HBQ7741260.1 ead/Ea22-like family protein [Klebsiella pneumoniae]HBW2787414.1 ead/Ea22-like family protein [Klebsiella pneumoniae]